MNIRRYNSPRTIKNKDVTMGWAYSSGEGNETKFQ